MKNWPKGGVAFQIFYNISGTAEDTNLKFCTLIEGNGPDTNK